MILDCFEHKMQHYCIKMEFLDTTSDDKDLPRFVTKEWIEVMINQKEIKMLIKKLESKHQC